MKPRVYPITEGVPRGGRQPTSQGTLQPRLDRQPINNFDTAHGSVGRIQLYPVTANGTVDTLAPVQLSHFNTGTYSRVFRVGLYVPAPAGTNQKPPGLSRPLRGIIWHLDSQ